MWRDTPAIARVLIAQLLQEIPTRSHKVVCNRFQARQDGILSESLLQGVLLCLHTSSYISLNSMRDFEK
jgi:hypothetical protein